MPQAERGRTHLSPIVVVGQDLHRPPDLVGTGPVGQPSVQPHRPVAIARSGERLTSLTTSSLDSDVMYGCVQVWTPKCCSSGRLSDWLKTSQFVTMFPPMRKWVAEMRWAAKKSYSREPAGRGPSSWLIANMPSGASQPSVGTWHPSAFEQIVSPVPSSPPYDGLPARARTKTLSRHQHLSDGEKAQLVTNHPPAFAATGTVSGGGRRPAAVALASASSQS